MGAWFSSNTVANTQALNKDLRLAITRLKLKAKQRTELSRKERVAIARLIEDDKADHARIRVEGIIRDDFLVEAYEILESFCQLLVLRFSLIQSMDHVPNEVAEAISSVLWAAPRVHHDIAEFARIQKQLQNKYGKEHVQKAIANDFSCFEPERVSQKLIEKLSVAAPSKTLVEKYLIEIAKCANVPFTPDARFLPVEVERATVVDDRPLIGFEQENQQGPTAPPATTPTYSPPYPLADFAVQPTAPFSHSAASASAMSNAENTRPMDVPTGGFAAPPPPFGAPPSYNSATFAFGPSAANGTNAKFYGTPRPNKQTLNDQKLMPPPALPLFTQPKGRDETRP